MKLYGDRVASPIGDLGLVVDEAGRVVCIAFLREEGASLAEATRRYLDDSDELLQDGARVGVLAEQLREYFEEDRRDFEIELAPRGSDFQQRVWRRLLEIPAGATCTYSDIARDLGRPSSARAVGRANATNPIPIIVPCHRVIGADGSLTGYAGGLEVKRALLELEGILPRSLF
ncbi:MAG: methylated-DNA--[protein]-cysteine S-methyltransferase [Acidobacteriota bacterium]